MLIMKINVIKYNFMCNIDLFCCGFMARGRRVGQRDLGNIVTTSMYIKSSRIGEMQRELFSIFALFPDKIAKTLSS